MEDSVTAGASETPTVAGDQFGRPHSVQVSQSLQLWILIPGLLVFLLVGEPESFFLWSRYNLYLSSSRSLPNLSAHGQAEAEKEEKGQEAVRTAHAQ